MIFDLNDNSQENDGVAIMNNVKTLSHGVLAVYLIFMSSGAFAYESIGNWLFDQESDQLYDTLEVTALNSDENGEVGLVLFCTNDDVLRIGFLWDEPLEDYARHGYKYTVAWRLDKNQPQHGNWIGVAQGTATRIEGREALDFIRNSFTGKNLYIRVTDRWENERDGSFDLEGINEVLSKSEKLCESKLNE